jgi:hypothetical protein
MSVRSDTVLISASNFVFGLLLGNMFGVIFLIPFGIIHGMHALIKYIFGA